MVVGFRIFPVFVNFEEYFEKNFDDFSFYFFDFVFYHSDPDLTFDVPLGSRVPHCDDFYHSNRAMLCLHYHQNISVLMIFRVTLMVLSI